MKLDFKTVGAIAAALVSIAAALALFGVTELPRPAWSSEVFKVAESLTELDSRVTCQQLDDVKLQYYQNLREQDSYETGQEPDYLVTEQIILERRIDDLEVRLDYLRNFLVIGD